MQRTIVAPAEMPDAALDELKQWLAIRSPAEDAALTAILRMALEMCEAFTGTLPIACTCEETLQAGGAWQALATRPVQVISAVERIADDGTRAALPPDAYAVDLAGDSAGLVRLTQGSGRVAVRFVAGLAPSWNLLPEAMRHGIIRLAADAWRARESGADTAPPAAVAALWRPWRRVRL